MAEKPKVKEVLTLLHDVVAEMCLTIQALDKSDIPTLLKAYKQLNEIKDTIDSAHKIINEQHQKLSYEVIPNAFEASGFDSVKAHGRNFVVSTRLNASIPEDKREAGYAWITNVLKLPELIKPTVNPRSLSSAVKEYFEANAVLPPEEAITVHQQKLTSIRKA